MLFHHNCDLRHSNLILATVNYKFREPEAQGQPPGMYVDPLSAVKFRAVDVHLMSSYASRSWRVSGVKLLFLLGPLIFSIASYVGLDKNASDAMIARDLLSSAFASIMCVSLETVLER